MCGYLTRIRRWTSIATVARRESANKVKIDAIERKLLANPEIAKLIDDLGT